MSQQTDTSEWDHLRELLYRERLDRDATDETENENEGSEWPDNQHSWTNR